MSRQRVPGSSMNKETWQSLEKATHLAWDMISPDDKAKILNHAMERAERTRQAAAVHQRSANVTNMSVRPILRNHLLWKGAQILPRWRPMLTRAAKLIRVMCVA